MVWGVCPKNKNIENNLKIMFEFIMDFVVGLITLSSWHFDVHSYTRCVYMCVGEYVCSGYGLGSVVEESQSLGVLWKCFLV